MQIAMIASSVSRLGGGLYTSVRRLGQSVQASSPNVSVHVLSTNDRFVPEDLHAWAPVDVRAHSTVGPWGFRYSPGIASDLRALDVDIAHVQHLWMYPSVATLAWHRKTQRPYIVSPRGMIDEWAMSRAKLKKWLAWHAFERAHLAKAHCIHALGESEVEGIRRSGIRTPICVIPNGIDVPDEGTEADFLSETGDHLQLLFLGRLHPKKGVSELLNGWKDWRRDDPKKARDWRLVLAGWGEAKHIAGFKQQVDELHLGENVRFAGPVFGDEKIKLLRSAAAFVLPSFSEGLPMAVLEAWSYRLPVLITPQCNLGEGIDKGAAIPIAPSAKSIKEGLAALAGLSSAERKKIGNIGYSLVVSSYNWASVASQMMALYQWAIGGGQQPSSVILK